MRSTHTALWLLLAAGLLGFIFFVQPHYSKPTPVSKRLLPQLTAAAVRSVQVRPAGSNSVEIIADRTNDTWRLVEPMVYPAEAASIEALLKALERLTSSVYITEAEIRSHTNADAEYGFGAPQSSIVLWQNEHRSHILLGSNTPPGDQVFVEVVGQDGAYVVDADLLKHIPRSANDWRDRELLGPEIASIDRIAVTNKATAFVLQREPRTRLWRIVSPLDRARADSAGIQDSLRQIENLRVAQFLPDELKPDVEALGLAPPEFELAFGRGSNTLAMFQFGKNLTNETVLAALGKSVTNAPGQVYGRRLGQNGLFSVATNLLARWWGASYNEFRDPHLLTLPEKVQSVAVKGQDAFSLERQTNDTWRVVPAGYTAEPLAVAELFITLTNLQVLECAKQVANPPDLPEYGLAAPVLQYSFRAAADDSAPSFTNVLNFGFGTNQHDRIFAQRADESSVYAISTNDFAHLPSASWQMHERRFWHFAMDEVAAVNIRQGGKSRRLLRAGQYHWSLASGSGSIEGIAVEETVRGLLEASAVAWVARGEADGTRYGVWTNAPEVTLELKDAGKCTIDFGNEAPSGNQYAAVQLDGQAWVCEFPWKLFGDVLGYLLTY